MIDRWSLALVRPPLVLLARQLANKGMSANQITVLGFLIGLFAVPLLGNQQFGWAALCIVLNRICDGLDGELARAQGPTDPGAYLDIVLDFIFYAAVVFGFALANPEQNALAACGLIFSFIGTASSFLAFAIMAERRGIQSVSYPNKGFYYLSGIMEGTETIVFFLLMCLLPAHFPMLAWIFFALCLLTTVTRIIASLHSLKN